MRLSMEVCDTAITARGAGTGITENQLRSVLHKTKIAHDGEWIECRLLASGERTNPWFQESGNRMIQAGDLVGFDTDTGGPNGYLADISRSYVCPGRAPSNNQRRLHALAQEQVLHQLGAAAARPCVPGVRGACLEGAEAVRAELLHGPGPRRRLCRSLPVDHLRRRCQGSGYDGIFRKTWSSPSKAISGETGGAEGVKLEQQVLITANGAEVLSRTPFEGTPSSHDRG